MVRVDSSFERNVALSMRGFSFSFDSNFGKYVKWTKAMKKQARVAARNLCIQWAKRIVEEAKKRCPQYTDGPNSLTESIKENGTTGRYSDANYGRSKISVDIGVDTDNWSSDYDAIVDALSARYPNRTNMLKSGKELVVLLHEQWDLLAGDAARERARIKGAANGVQVGSQFLLRAYTENEGDLKMQAVTLMTDAMSLINLKNMGY